MMLFVLVVAASVGIAFLLRNRLEYAVAAVIAARYFIPSSASVEFVPFLDPSVYLLVAVFLVQLIWNFSGTLKAFYLSRVEIFVFAMLMLLAVANIFSQFVSPLSAASDIIRIYLAPFLLYVLIRALCFDGTKKILVVIYGYLLFSVVQSVMAIIQNQQGALLVWESAFRRLWVGEDGGFGRSQGFLEFGLGLGSAMILAMVFCFWIRSAVLRFGLALLFLYTMLLSSSRAALIVGILLFVIMAFYAARSYAANFVVFAAAGGAMAGFVATGGAEEIFEKIQNDNGSTARRIEAYSWFLQNMESFVFTGYPGTRDFRGSQTLSSSLENALFMAAVNYGLVFAVILIGLLLFIAFRSFRYGKLAIIAGIGLLGFLMVENTNSAFSSLSFTGYALWVLAGVCSYNAGSLLRNLPSAGRGSNAPETVNPVGEPTEEREPEPVRVPVGAMRQAPYRRYVTDS